MKNSPLCSVVMSVYNGEEYLSIAIESILRQTYKNFEFIIINDGSTDQSLNIIKSYDDNRIITIQNENNIFLAASLNKGIRSAKGKYIIRMDADDVSISTRFEEQITFMENNPSIGLSGTNAEIIGSNSGCINYEQSSNLIKFNFLHECHLLHPTLIIRKELIERHDLYYNESLRKNQDYELFTRAIQHTEIGNLPNYLLQYRETTENVKRSEFNQQENINSIKKNLFKKVGYNISEHELDLYGSIIKQKYTGSKHYIINACKLLHNLSKANSNTSFYEVNSFQMYNSQLIENVCRNTKKAGMTPLVSFVNYARPNNLIRKSYILLTLVVKFLVK